MRVAAGEIIVPDHVRGRATGLSIPAHSEALLADGAPFLTRAFRAAGVLPADNRVVRIASAEACLMGSVGHKLFLTLDYARASGLPAELFVKFSRHFVDGFHDRRRFEVASEVDLLQLAQITDFPIAVPRTLFADCEPETGTGVLITERIRFGEGAIEPLHLKCMDHLLDNSIDHYSAIVVALARLAGAQHAGRLSPEVDRLFPFDPEAAVDDDPITATPDELDRLIDEYTEFAAACPRLIPAHLRNSAFLGRLRRNVLMIARHQRAIKRHLHADPQFVALSHFNANIDNAWFWREGGGPLQCGLFDWQRARQMNVAYALWGALSSADPDIWSERLDELLALFVDELRCHGGPDLPIATLLRHLHLYSATIGVAQLLVAPAVVRSRLSGIEHVTGLRDPLLLASEGARCFLHVFTAFLNLMTLHDFDAELPQILADIGCRPDDAESGLDP